MDISFFKGIEFMGAAPASAVIGCYPERGIIFFFNKL